MPALVQRLRGFVEGGRPRCAHFIGHGAPGFGVRRLCLRLARRPGISRPHGATSRTVARVAAFVVASLERAVDGTELATTLVLPRAPPFLMRLSVLRCVLGSGLLVRIGAAAAGCCWYRCLPRADYASVRALHVCAVWAAHWWWWEGGRHVCRPWCANNKIIFMIITLGRTAAGLTAAVNAPPPAGHSFATLRVSS